MDDGLIQTDLPDYEDVPLAEIDPDAGEETKRRVDPETGLLVAASFNSAI